MIRILGRPSSAILRAVTGCFRRELSPLDGLTHFLAQVVPESGDLTIEYENIENMKYKAPQLMQICGVGRHSAAIPPAEAEHLAMCTVLEGGVIFRKAG